MLITTALLVFFISVTFILGALYVFIEAPMSKKKLIARLSGLGKVSVTSEESPDLLRREVYSDIPVLDELLAAVPGIQRVTLFLHQAGVQILVGSFLLIVLGAGAFGLLMGFLTKLPGLALLLAFVVPAYVPILVVTYKRNRRLAKFDELFPEAIDFLARAVRSSHAFTTGFEMIGNELADPLGEEFRLTFQQQRLGMPLREALENLMVRVPSSDVRVFVSALQIQRDTGGNLAVILDTLSQVIRERYKLMRQIRVFTAEGRMSMYMLTAIPFVAMAAMAVIMPDYMKPLFTETSGQRALAVAGILQVIGYFIIRRMIKIKV